MKSLFALVSVIILTLLVIFLQPSDDIWVDKFSQGTDFTYVVRSAGFDVKNHSDGLMEYFDNSSNFGKGDILLARGRLLNDSDLVCESIKYYKLALDNASIKEKALIYETIASIGCGENSNFYLGEASQLWVILNDSLRSMIDYNISSGISVIVEYDETELGLSKINMSPNATKLVIGRSFVKINSSDLIVSQTDRVTRDWLSYQLFNSLFENENLLSVFSERLFYTEEELRSEIGWHEGARIKEIKESGSSHQTSVGIIARLHNGKWYTHDEKGVFRFEIPIDKISYPTTRFLDNQTAVIVDTHGMNMIARDAIENNASVAIACCDHPGKIKAVKYLSDKGISSVCFTDKYLPYLIGSGVSAVGSPPIKNVNGEIVLGNQSVTILLNETIVVESVHEEKFGWSYYVTPFIYFETLKNITDIEIKTEVVKVSSPGEAYLVTNRAKEIGSRVIAVRVFNKADYDAVKLWLEENKNNRAVLFHSTSYPYGYLLMKEFENQTSFDDVNPIFE